MGRLYCGCVVLLAKHCCSVAFVQDELNKQFVKLYNSGNMNGLSELFTEDCKMMAPGSDTVKGRAGN